MTKFNKRCLIQIKGKNYSCACMCVRGVKSQVYDEELFEIRFHIK